MKRATLNAGLGDCSSLPGLVQHDVNAALKHSCGQHTNYVYSVGSINDDGIHAYIPPRQTLDPRFENGHGIESTPDFVCDINYEHDRVVVAARSVAGLKDKSAH